MHRDGQPANGRSISPDRLAEIEEITDGVTRWAAKHHDIVGVLLVGSCARNAARPDSDIDLVLLTTDESRYADGVWADGLALGTLIGTQSWGAVVERRFSTTSGLERELNFGGLSWASTAPVDPGTEHVVADGARILRDPAGVLSSLLQTCQATSAQPPASTPSWPRCGHGTTAPPFVGCRGIRIHHDTCCLAHLADADRTTHLAGPTPEPTSTIAALRSPNPSCVTFSAPCTTLPPAKHDWAMRVSTERGSPASRGSTEPPSPVSHRVRRHTVHGPR